LLVSFSFSPLSLGLRSSFPSLVRAKSGSFTIRQSKSDFWRDPERRAGDTIAAETFELYKRASVNKII
jgi:hypothetical protein